MGDKLKRAGFIGIVAVQVLLLLGIIYTRHSWVNDGQKVLLRTTPVDPRSLMRGDYVRLSYEIGSIELDSVAEDGEFVRGEDIYVSLREGSGGVYEAASLWHGPPVAGHPFIKGRVASRGPIFRKDITVEFENGSTREFDRVQNRWIFDSDDEGDVFLLCLSGGTGAIVRAYSDDKALDSQCQEGTEGVRVVLREVRESKPLSVSVDYTIDSYFVEEGAGRELERMRDMGEVLVEAALRDDGMPLISALIVNGQRLK